MLIVIIVIILVFVTAIAVGIIVGIKKGMEERSVKRENKKIRQQEIADKIRTDREQAEKRQQLEQAIDDYRFDFEMYASDKDAPWTDEYIERSEHNDRIARAYMQRDKMQLLAYDPRYHIGKIKGTSFKHYLTSASLCTCEDFHQRLSPCKHMFFLAHEIQNKSGDTFMELDYEQGLYGLTGFVFGRFKDGKDSAVRNLQERGMITYTNQSSETRLAVAGKSNAVRLVENLADRGIPVFEYADALQLFTSEIRHPEIVNDVT